VPVHSVERKLAAILAADVVGYSRLMGEDEAGTLARLKEHRRELIDLRISEHKGRIVKTTGDGILIEFPSVVEAVACAVAVQGGMAERNATTAEEQRIVFRVGVNLGDIIIAEDNDIHGDGVNVAARLEGIAEPGGICVSGIVHDQVRDKLDCAFEDIGEQALKNIVRPVRVYAIRPETIADMPAPRAPPAASISPPAIAPRLSIVVLPFANLSDDREQQYFADAITEDLTTDLSRLADMLVISRNTAFTYRNKPVDTKQIGRELCVRYVLEGSVQRSGNRVRVTAQLIDAETDLHLWAERFAGDAGDLFALQDEITSRIAVELKLELIRAEADRPTANPDVLDYIFRGRAAGSNNYTETISLFERALALDPRSVEAQIHVAGTLVGGVLDLLTDSAAADTARAEGLIRQVLAVSPHSPRAHWVKGQVLRAQGRFAEAIPEYETVIASDRNWVFAIANLGWCKFFTGSIEEVIPLHEQAIRLSPREPNIANWYSRIGRVHLLQSRTDKAIVWLEKARSANPTYPLHHLYPASAYALQGDSKRAAAALADARRLIGNDRFSSIARIKATPHYFGAVPGVQALFETTFFAGLQKAGVPAE
jgi:adenylate cyclase